MSEDPVIMNEMFQAMMKSDVTAAVFLKNGIRLIGKIKKIDPEAILISGPHTLGCAVMRDSIATAQPFTENPRDRSSSR